MRRLGNITRVAHDSALAARIADVTAAIEANAGAAGSALVSARGVTLYKVANKIFAILELTRSSLVILKCDPSLIEVLKAKYAGVGHRGHLDRRFWISVAIDSDVPVSEIERLISWSYDAIVASLPKKQRTALECRATPPVAEPQHAGYRGTDPAASSAREIRLDGKAELDSGERRRNGDVRPGLQDVGCVTQAY